MGDDGWRVRGMWFRAGGNNGGGDSVREQRRDGWVPASARTTGGEGQPQGLPLRGADGGGSSRTGSSVWTGGSRTVPTGRVGWMGMTGGGCGGCGSAQVGTMAGEILCGSNGGRDGSPHPRGQRGEGQPQGVARLWRPLYDYRNEFRCGVERFWIPAFAGMTYGGTGGLRVDPAGGGWGGGRRTGS